MIQVYTHFVHRGSKVDGRDPYGQLADANEREAELHKIKLAIHLLSAEFKTWAWRNSNRITVLCRADEVALFCLQQQELVENFKVWESPFPSPAEATNLAYPVNVVDVAKDIRVTYPRVLADLLTGV